MDDLLSNLPDDVLCHILSFLTTNQTALTSVLSKRWRNLIAFVPILEIPHQYFGKGTRDDIGQRFIDFVDRVLALQGSSHIKKFSLDCIGIDSVQVDAWISNVLARNVSELDLTILLDLHSVDIYHLPPNCFENKNLVTLKLGFEIDTALLDGSVFLPMLKTLVLDTVSLFVDKFEFLLNALPVLEELVLFNIDWEDSDVADLIVSSASLKTLKIVSSPWLDTLSFNTPSLVNFSYCDNVAEDYPLVTMEKLFEARINLLIYKDEINRARAQDNDFLEDDEDHVVLRFTNVGKIMNGIKNVQYLDLSPDTVEVLSLCCEYMPMFGNLKTLTIKSNESRGWQAMPVLLRNCPHLETLVLEGLLHHVTDKCGDACDCVSREDKGCSLTSCPIKVLKIREFQGTIKEMHMIKHFLDYFPRLKEIKINMDENDFTQCKVLEVSQVMAEKMELNNKSSSCNIQLMLSGYLCKKWTAQ